MDLTLERLVAGGDALARDADGRVVFVRGGLPGEVVRVEIDGTKRDFATGHVVEVLEPSPDRIEPACPHRRRGCGGCDWMHLTSEAQSAAKAGIVRESLRRIGHLDPDRVEELVESGAQVDPAGTRTTIRVVGVPGGGIGFRERRSDVVVDIDACLVAHPRLSALLPDLAVDPGVELTLRTSVATRATTARWTGRGRVAGLPDDVHTGDRAWLVERIAGVDLRVSAASFFQPGPDAAELLVDAVTRAAPELATARHAVDAYGGVGLFAATAMAGAERVTLVESSRSGCHDARRNLRGRNADVVRSEVGRGSPDDAANRAANGAAVDVVVADPARSGLGRPGVAALVGAAPDVIVLVSCDPVSLARDVSLLEADGYRGERVEVLDLFPETHHVETVTRVTAADS